jgi:hypothetical protein
MKQTIRIGAILLALVLLAGGGVLWLANAHIMPTTQTVEQAIPDDRIPH